MAPFWIKLTASELSRHKIVHRVHIYPTHLAVRYKNKLIDKYYFVGKSTRSLLSFNVTKRDLKIGPSLSIQRTYEIDPFSKSEQIGCAHHFHIDKKHFRTGSFIDGRLAIHRFISLLMHHKPIIDRYPEQSIKKWIGILRKFDYNRMITSNAFNFHKSMSRYIPWHEVLWQFFPPSLSYKPRKVAIILNRAAYGLAPINTTTINFRLLRHAIGSTLNQLAYCSIFNKIKAKNAVIDLHPEYGYKAVACGILGMHYIYNECDQMTMARDRNIEQILGLTCEPLKNQSADVLISDANFKHFDIESANPHLQRVNTMIAYVPRADRLKLAAMHQPTKIIKILCKYRRIRKLVSVMEDPDFLFIW